MDNSQRLIQNSITSKIIGVFDDSQLKGIVRMGSKINGAPVKEFIPLTNLNCEQVQINTGCSYAAVATNIESFETLIINKIDNFIINRIKQMAINNTQPSVTIPSLNPIFKASYIKALDAMVQNIHLSTNLSYEPFLMVADNIAEEVKVMLNITNQHLSNSAGYKGDSRPIGTYANTIVFSTPMLNNNIVVGVKGVQTSACGFAIDAKEIIIENNDGNAVISFKLFSDNMSEHFFNVINIG